MIPSIPPRLEIGIDSRIRWLIRKDLLEFMQVGRTEIAEAENSV
jgi:hypothetical protein